MKNFYRITMIAIVAIALIGCSKNESGPQSNTFKRTVTVSVTKGADTKTAVNEGTTASYVWTEGDDQYFNIYENGSKGTVDEVEYSDNMKTATLTVSFNSNLNATEYVYTAKFCKDTSKAGNPKINEFQAPQADSYDPSADVMIAETITSQSALNSLQFTMNRVVSVNKMTLTGLTSGEKINKVEVIFSNAIAGFYLYSGNNAGSYNLTERKLTLSYSDIIVPSGGSFPVYFIVGPVSDASFESVVVTTDKHVYTKNTSCNPNPFEGKTISFACGKFTRFNMGLSGYDSPISTAVTYTKVISDSSLPAIGKKVNVIIVGKADSKFYAIAEQKNNNRGSDDITSFVDNNTISLDNSVGAHIFSLVHSSEGYLLMDNDGNGYLCATGTSSNLLKTTKTLDDKCYWNISCNEDNASIVNSNEGVRGVLLFNKSDKLFACYASTTQSPVSIYLDLNSVEDYVEKENPELSYATTSYTVNLEDTFTTPILTNPHNLTVSYTSSNTDVATVNASTGAVTLVAAGTTTITANFAGDDTYKAGSASYTLEVKTPVLPENDPAHPYSVSTILSAIAELPNSSATEEKYYISGKISSVTSYNSTYHSITYSISEDGSTTEELIVYGGLGLNGNGFSGLSDLTVGDDVVVYGSIQNYNGNKPQIAVNSILVSRTPYTVTEPDANTSSNPYSVSYILSAFNNFPKNYETETTYYVSGTVESIEEIGTTYGNATYYITDGTNHIYVFRGKNIENSDFTSSDLAVGDVVVVYGKLKNYNGTTPEITNSTLISREHIAVAHQILFSQPTGGTFTVKVDGVSISSGASVMEGKTVTLTATPGNNYTFSSWNVTGASVTSSSSATTSFIVGTTDVTISATFENNAVTYSWVKKDISALQDGDVFVLVGTSGSTNYAMSNNNGTANPPSAVSVNVSNNKLSSEPAATLQWIAGVSSGNYTFYANTSKSTWLYCTSTNNGIRVGTNANKEFTIADNYLKHSSTGRYVGIYNEADWRCYTSINNNITGQSFFVYVKTANQ